MWILANKKYCEQVFLVYNQQLGFEYLECIIIKPKNGNVQERGYT